MDMIKNYLQKITEKYLHGDAREESYYEILSVYRRKFGNIRSAVIRFCASIYAAARAGQCRMRAAIVV